MGVTAMADEFVARKASTLPVITSVDPADKIMVINEGAPPDVVLAPMDALAALAGSYAPAGPTGATGPVGATGPAGKDLAVKGSVANQAALPSTGVVDGDTYVTADTGKLWVYDSGPPAGWTAIATAIGPQGPKGDTGNVGAAGPAGPQGVQGPAGVGIAGANVPVGTVLDYVGTTAPAGFLMCDGAEHDQTLYPQLAAILVGSNWAQAGTVGKFRVPNLNGKTTVGIDPVDAAFGVVGKIAGSKNAVAIDHNHPAGPLAMQSHDHSVDIWSSFYNVDHLHTFTTGGAGAHNHGIPDGSLMWRYNPNGSEGATTTPTGQRRDNIQHSDVGDHAHSGTTNAMDRSGDHRHAVNGRTGGTGGAVTGTTANAGVDGTNRNLQPYAVLSKIIRATV